MRRAIMVFRLILYRLITLSFFLQFLVLFLGFLALLLGFFELLLEKTVFFFHQIYGSVIVGKRVAGAASGKVASIS